MKRRTIDPGRFRRICRWLGIHPGSEVWRAAAYLERQGQEFLVHFGTDNAVEKAREHWRGRRKPKPKGKVA